jgi:hypothetical protein
VIRLPVAWLAKDKASGFPTLGLRKAAHFFGFIAARISAGRRSDSAFGSIDDDFMSASFTERRKCAITY